MTRKLFFLFLLLGLLSRVSAQNLPEPYVIISDTAVMQALPEKYLQVLEDKGGQLTFEQVSGRFSTNFHIAKLIDLQFAHHTYWFRYILKNGMPHDAKICFPANSEESTYYIQSGNRRWQQYENGWLTPWSRGPELRFEQLIPVTLKSGEQVIVINRLQNGYYYYFVSENNPISFGNTERFQSVWAENDSFYVSSIHDAALFGFLMFAAILNFFFFLIVRERVYLFFSIYLVLIAIGRIYSEAYLVFLREFRLPYSYLMAFCFGFSVPFLMLFIRALLQTKTWLPRWDKFLKLITFVAFAIQAIVFIPNPLSAPTNGISFISSILLIISMLISFVLLYRKGKTTPSLMAAILPAFAIWGIGWSIVILYKVMGLTIAGKAVTVWLNDWWYVIETISLCWLVLFYSWILLHRFRRLQKEIAARALEAEKEKNALIAEQKIELEKTVEERTTELKQSLIELKSTQSQLIQSEKMASLGELTAGIAHEIQNPLNFVNNFSEVNREMLAELQLELDKGDIKEAKAIAAGLEQNEQKISHHGKRADFIVKGMLEHSRKSTGEKQPTNMNVLCDEFFRLSYHGLRAKDKSFNAEMVTHFAPDLPKINLSQQDMGRVMLNLFNNAFYAVHQKAKTAGVDYKPTIEVTTKVSDDKVIISVRDNGPGIPENIKDKIMQPFFTTKPTGEGTGLGLSLSYDIVKAHGGELKVETAQNGFTEFIVLIPIT